MTAFTRILSRLRGETPNPHAETMRGLRFALKDAQARNHTQDISAIIKAIGLYQSACLRAGRKVA